MLRALRRLLRPSGRIAYTTIHVAPGLSATDRRRAHRAGPRAVASRSDAVTLLESAGFTDIASRDVTDEFAATAHGWITEVDAHAEEIAEQEGPAAFAERQRDRRRQLRAVKDGLLRRGIFSASRPDQPIA